MPGITTPEKHAAKVEAAAREYALFGKLPGAKTQLMQALLFVRSKGSCPTSDVAVACVWTQMYATKKLKELQKRRLIGRQEPLPIKGSYESTWTAEKVAK